ncbi:unnamed protein product [Thlaspi arvense]|uniref:DUF1985 domain-containing protein n=1 Tax=Thlaspi arvense TaxID=13288 RepID=A0AAU9T6C9_THLAR|nr:unnamed protein product [Thlaspi arvense]
MKEVLNIPFLVLLVSVLDAKVTKQNIANFLRCLRDWTSPENPITEAIYTPAIIAAKHESQATVVCAKSNGIKIRIRSGSHNLEGLSYISCIPFVILEMHNLPSITIDVSSKKPWVQAGARGFLFDEETRWHSREPGPSLRRKGSANAMAFPHRKGNLFKIQYFVLWTDANATNVDLGLMKELYEVAEPYVSSNPREAFLNYRDIDVGSNPSGKTGMETNVLPHRLFADHQEPVGDRVNSYFKLDTLGVILKDLTPDELRLIRPCFGKLIDMYHKPAHSGKLAHFLLTRQLKMEKRHELWFIFGSKPVKFSLREFAIVTGLNCKPISPPPREMLKCKPGEVPNWFALFGGDENVTGEKLAVMLRRSKNLSSELKHCFEMTVQCIKTRTTNQLTQPTVAIQSFVHAVQMVLLEAVPTALMTMGEENGSESEEEECVTASTLKLDKLWDLDLSGQVAVTSIIKADTEEIPPATLEWQDEVPDPKVDYMEMLIAEGAKFCRDSFIGGHVGPPPPAQSSAVKSQKKSWPSVVKDKPAAPLVRAKKPRKGRNSVKASHQG